MLLHCCFFLIWQGPSNFAPLKPQAALTLTESNLYKNQSTGNKEWDSKVKMVIPPGTVVLPDYIEHKSAYHVDLKGSNRDAGDAFLEKTRRTPVWVWVESKGKGKWVAGYLDMTQENLHLTSYPFTIFEMRRKGFIQLYLRLDHEGMVFLEREASRLLSQNSESAQQ